MPNESFPFQFRSRQSIPGKLYVDQACIYCELCVETAPAIFAYDSRHGEAYVKKQPENGEELASALEALDGCPCENIHSDGQGYEWSKPIKNLSNQLLEHHCSCHKKPSKKYRQR